MNRIKNIKIDLPLVVSIIFFVVSALTISDYGVSWDEPVHLNRGQGYLRYFLSGETGYENLDQVRMSYFQNSSESAAYFLENDSGHPPLNGIMAALFNYTFYQRLGILGDIESYHLFIIVAATFLVYLVSAFASEVIGKVAGLVAGIAMASYPLFFAESHFNIKDPVETALFTATIYFFWKSLKRYDWRLLLISGLFCGFALGTKFNILFLPFILVPWVAVLYRRKIYKPLKLVRGIPSRYLVVMVLTPLLIFAIFFFTWPFLWQDPVNNLKSVFVYYKDIGTRGRGQVDFLLPFGFNSFPAIWIAITTPPIVLILFLIGVVRVIFCSDKKKVGWLWLMWFLIPVARVSVPGASIYGGVRQIMEYLPPMALIAGAGADSVHRLFGRKMISVVMILAMFVPHFGVMTRLHPNQNVYFNFLVGGLRGAQEKNVPYWGNSFGNAYLQIVKWLNENAEEGSKLALIQGTEVNIPRVYLSSKVSLSNGYWSGMDRTGEYLVELTHEGNKVAYPWVWDYVEKVLEPVYEVKVEGVAIAKLWKNDVEHSRVGFGREESLVVVNTFQRENYLEVEFGEEVDVSRITGTVGRSNNCAVFTFAGIATSIDHIFWKHESEKIGDFQISNFPSFDGENLNYMLPARRAKYLRIIVDEDGSCLYLDSKLMFLGFKAFEQ